MAKSPYRIGLFYLFTMFFWGALYAYMSFLTPYAEKMGASATLAGLIVGGYGLVQMLLRIPAGLLSDRLRRRKPFLLIGALAATVSALGMYLFPSPMGLLVFRALCGIAAAAWVSITVLFSSYFPPDQAPQALSKLNAFNMAGNMGASLLGAALAQRAGEATAFLLAVCLGVAAMVISLFLKENRPPATNAPSVSELLRVGKTPLLLVASALAVLVQVVNMGTSGSVTQALAKTIGASTGQLGFLTLANGLPVILASTLGGVLLRKLKPGIIVAAGSLLIAAALLCMPSVRSFPALLALQAVQGFGSGMTLPMLMSMAILTISAEKRGVAMGFFQSIYALGMFVGPVASGAIRQSVGLHGSFYAMGLIAVVMAVCSALFLRVSPRRAA